MLAGAAGAIVAARLPSPSRTVDVRAFGARAGTDALPACRAALRRLAAQGGGTLLMPAIGGYLLSDTLTITVPHCHVELHDDVRLTKETAAGAIVFLGDRHRPLVDVSLTGIGARRVIDGNARHMRGYRYSLTDNFYSCVLFRWCEGWRIENIHAFNGLVSCIRAWACGPGLDIDCDGSHAAYDNGHAIEFDPPWRVPPGDDPAGWSRARLVRPRAWGCAGLGVGSYAATGVQIEDAHIRGCGNDIAGHPNNGGGLSVEADIGRPNERDHRVLVLRPLIEACHAQGIHVSARGARIVAPVVTDTIAPRARADRLDIMGAGVVIVGAGTATIRDARIGRSGTHGIAMLGAGGQSPSLDFHGEIAGSHGHGIHARRAARVAVRAGSTIAANGTAAGHAGVHVADGGWRHWWQPPQGEIAVAGTITGSAGAAIDVSDVADARLGPLDLVDNRRLADAGPAIRLAREVEARIAGVRNRDARGRTTTIVEQESGWSRLSIDDVSGTARDGVLARP